MNRIIRVTSDNENIIRKKLQLLAKKKEGIIASKYHIYHQIYSDIFFAPNPDKKEYVLGQFYEIGRYIVLNEALIAENTDYDTIKNIFLHELAHALDYSINYNLSGHSPEFRQYCKDLGVEDDFDKARVKNVLKEKKNRKNKIEKLMALSSSPFENEAMLALSKAQKLLLEDEQETSPMEKLYIVDLYSAGRIPFYITKLSSFVSNATGAFVLKCMEKPEIVIRAYGDLNQVEFSIYLFDYILDSLESEVKKLRTEGKKISKDSFLLGAIPVMEKKLFSCDSTTSNALTVKKDQNEQLVRELVYKTGVRYVKRGARVLSRESYAYGASFAGSLEIPKGIDQKKIT